MSREEKLEVLKKVLEGSISVDKALPALYDAIKDENGAFVAFLEEDGTYSISDPRKVEGIYEGLVKGFSEAEFKRITRFHHALVMKIIRDPNCPPIAHCEKDVVL